MTSWRDVLPIHPAADLFPLMTPDELAALAADIEANGLHMPVTVIENNPDGIILLDGRNRLDALELIGVEIVSSHYQRASDKAKADPYAYVLSANVHRRHLTAEQRRELVAKIIAADPSKSSRQVAKLTGVSPTTATKVRDQLVASGDVSNVDTLVDSTGRQQPAHKPQLIARPLVEARSGVVSGKILLVVDEAMTQRMNARLARATDEASEPMTLTGTPIESHRPELMGPPPPPPEKLPEPLERLLADLPASVARCLRELRRAMAGHIQLDADDGYAVMAGVRKVIAQMEREVTDRDFDSRSPRSDP